MVGITEKDGVALHLGQHPVTVCVSATFWLAAPQAESTRYKRQKLSYSAHK